VMDQPVAQVDGGGRFRNEASPLVEGPMAGHSERHAFIGGGDKAPASSRGANQSSSTMTKSARGVWSITLPTELSASPR
jgi:hypothetical protein